jgi:formylglycine-generating enzyme required for sulfatase activity
MKIIIPLLVALFLISFTTKKKKKFKSPENFVFIPSGTSQLNDKTYSCAAFFMLEHEVTNLEYRTFLNQLKKEGKSEEYEIACPDSTQWSKIGGSMDPMKENYFSHPAYDNYPVVNITKEGANLFCIYLTEYYRSIYGDVINDFRLPTKLEWVYAAKSGRERASYPWSGPYLRDEKGCYLANFKVVGDQNISITNGEQVVVADSLKISGAFVDGAFITAPVNSYEPNDYGLYNMSGNVAELVAKENLAMGGHWNSTGHDIRVVSEEKFENPNPFVGFRPVLSYVTQK